MESMLLGLATPSLISGATGLGKAVQTATRPFANLLQAAVGQRTESESLSAAVGSGADLLPVAGNPHLILLGELLTGQPVTTGSGSLEIADIRDHAEGLRSDLENRVRQALSGAGVQSTDRLLLRIAQSDGRLEVVGENSQRLSIEAALASDPSLARDFRQLAAIEQLLTAADQDSDFAEAYSRNPWSAVANYAGRFDSRAEAELSISPLGSEAELRFA